VEYVQGALALVSIGSSIFGGMKGKSASEKAADEEARLEGVVTEAKVRSLRKEERTLAGDTRAAAAASGVKADMGSPLDILKEQAITFQEEINTVKKSGATRSSQAQTRGRMAGNQAMYRGLSDAFSIASNYAGSFS
jgi:hypothetical protein